MLQNTAGMKITMASEYHLGELSAFRSELASLWVSLLTYNQMPMLLRSHIGSRKQEYWNHPLPEILESHIKSKQQENGINTLRNKLENFKKSVILISSIRSKIPELIAPLNVRVAEECDLLLVSLLRQIDGFNPNQTAKEIMKWFKNWVKTTESILDGLVTVADHVLKLIHQNNLKSKESSPREIENGQSGNNLAKANASHFFSKENNRIYETSMQVLNKKEFLIFKHLWEKREETVDFSTLAKIPGVFRKEITTEAVRKRLKRIRNKLREANPSNIFDFKILLASRKAIISVRSPKQAY